MPAAVAEHLQLDLRAEHCWELSLTVTISPSSAKLESLKELAKRGSQARWPWVFSETYEVGGAQYTRKVMLHPAKEAGALTLHVDFSRRKEAATGKVTVLSLLQTLSDPEETVDAETLAHFDYGSDEGVSTVALPIEISVLEGSPEAGPPPNGPRRRLQVRGLRFTQLDAEGSIDSSVVMDRPSNAGFHLTVEFTRSSTISSELPGTMLKRASGIAGSFFKLASGSWGTAAAVDKGE